MVIVCHGVAMLLGGIDRPSAAKSRPFVAT